MKVSTYIIVPTFLCDHYRALSYTITIKSINRTEVGLELAAEFTQLYKLFHVQIVVSFRMRQYRLITIIEELLYFIVRVEVAEILPSFQRELNRDLPWSSNWNMRRSLLPLFL